MRDDRTVYIAAPWVHKAFAAQAQERFEEAGWTVVSRWIHNHGDDHSLATLRTQAEEDIKDLRRADIFVLIHLQKSEGKATELGMALAWGVPTIIVGYQPTENIFHSLSTIFPVNTVGDALLLANDLIR